MTKSYELINYKLRPAKSIERKMFCEAFHRLSSFSPLHTYQYIGFGSTYFSDFNLFHKTFGMKNMISIEKDKENANRFNYNKPYSCIKIKWGTSNDVLPELELNQRTILWLDYDGYLSDSVLADLKTFCHQAVSGSVMIISVCVRPERLEPDRVKKLENDVGTAKVPAGTKEKDLLGWGYAKICREIIHNEIRSSLRQKNKLEKPENEMLYNQIFNFHYKDSVNMLTVGGIIYERKDGDKVKACSFSDLDFVTTRKNIFKIESPNLTYKEIRSLEEQLPKMGRKRIKGKGIPVEDIKKYSKVYRYFTKFVDAEL